MQSVLSEELPSVWAVVNRKIDGAPWTHRGREYLIGIQDCDVRTMVLIGGAGWGKTQAMLNRVFHRVDKRGWSVLFLLPTMDEVSDFSQGKFREACEGSGYLGRLFESVDNVHYKRAVGGQEVYLRGTQKLSKMVGLHVNLIVTDELDHCVQDNVSVAMERVSGKAEAQREFMFSCNPTIPEYGIERQYELSDQRLYMLRCRYCGDIQDLRWPDSIEWREGKPETARYRCMACKRRWTPTQLRVMVREAQADGALGWIPAFPGREVAGFRLSQLYSPTVTAKQIVQAWEAAQGNVGLLSTFYRYKVGIGYVAEGARLTPDVMEACKEARKMAGKSDQGAYVGVDVGLRLHVDVSEFPDGPNGVKRVIWAGTLRSFEELGQLLKQYRFRGCVIDASPERREVERIKEAFGARVYAAFYPNITSTAVWTEKTGKVSLNRTFWLDQVTARFRTRRALLPRDIPGEYGQHLCHLCRVEEQDVHGNPVSKYVATGEDHFAHAAVYCEAAASRFGQVFDFDEWRQGSDPSFQEEGFEGAFQDVVVGDDEGWGGGYRV